MRSSWTFVVSGVACLAWLACGSEPPPAKPAGPTGVQSAKVQASLVALTAHDVKSTTTVDECTKARADAAAGASEPEMAAIAKKLELVCRAADAWAVLLRVVPPLEGSKRAGECAKLNEQLAHLASDGVDIGALRAEHGRACRTAEPFIPSGELAKVQRLDPKSKNAIAICRDARTEALTVMLRDRLAGREREKVLDVLCALPDLFGNLETAAAKDKPAEQRDGACLSVRVWMGVLTKAKALKGKPLAQAKAGFKKSCKKWQKADPISELSKLAKLDPKSKDARALCTRAQAWVTANENAGARTDLAAPREKTCAQVEAWAIALDSPCTTAAERLEKKEPLLDAADYKAIKDEQRDRCK